MGTSSDPLLSLSDVEVVYKDKPPLIDQVLPRALSRRFDWDTDEVRAVDGVSLDVEENDVVAIVGESGSGKTTLGKTAVALEEPTGGTVEYRGHDIWKVKSGETTDRDIRFEDIRRSLQIIHQDPGAALNPYRSLMSSLEQPLKRWHPDLSAADRRERILELLGACGLSPAEEYIDRYPHELSGGEQQRITLIRALFAEPDVILADEAVGALDPSLRVEIMDLMLEFQEMFQTAYLFVSHSLEHARYIASKADGRIAIMYLGEIVEIGPVEEVIQNPSHPYTKVLKWASLPMDPDSARKTLEEDIPLRSLEVPDVKDKPSGCYFHTRCPEAREACRSARPELAPADGDADHEVSCFRELDDHEYWNSSELAGAEDQTAPNP